MSVTKVNLFMTPDRIGDIADQGLRRLYEYWLSLNQSDTPPRRTDLDPVEIPDLLEWFFIYDVQAALPEGRIRDYRMRLAGDRLCALFGREMRGLLFDEIHPQPIAADVRGEFDGVVDRALPHYAHRRAMWNQDKPLSYERLALPLIDDDGRVGHIAGAAVFAPIHYLQMDYYR